MHVERTAARKPNGRRVENIHSSTPATGGQYSYATVIAIALLACAAFANSLTGGFHFDDESIFLTPAIVGGGPGLAVLHWSQTRPLTFLTFHWNYLFSGSDPLSYHVVNVALHALNSVLVFLLARRFVPGAAWFAAALFAVHPLQTQAVDYVFERATLLAATFAVSAAILYFRGRYGAAVLAFAVSLLAKEETVALPAFLLLIDLADRRRPAWRALAGMGAVAFAATVRLFAVLQATAAPTLGFSVSSLTPLTYALTQCRVFWRYIGLFLWPAGLNLDHDIRASRSLFDPATTALGLAALVVGLAVLVWLVVRRQSAAASWTLGFVLLLAPSTSIVPVQDLMFEHRLYFPMVALTLAVALLFLRLPSWRTPAAIALLAVLFALTVARNAVWHSQESLWTDVTEKSPEKARGWFQLARLHAPQDPARAVELYRRGLQLEPESADGWMNLGLLLAERGDSEAALDDLQKALGLQGNKALILNNIGSVQLRLGQITPATESFRASLQSDPCRFDARYNLVRTLDYAGDRAAARAAAAVPDSCALLPEQKQQLEALRTQLP